MTRRELREPPPVQADSRKTIQVGIGIWVVVQLVALVGFAKLRDAGHPWLVLTPTVGVVLGLYGLRFMRKTQSPR